MSSFSSPGIMKSVSGLLSYFTLGAPITFAHGLGVVPSDVQIEFVCQTAQSTFLPGDILVPGIGVQDTVGNGYGISVTKDATNIVLNCPSLYYIVPNTGTGAQFQPTPASWKIRLRVIA